MTSPSIFQVMEVLDLTNNMRLEVQPRIQELEECDYDYPNFLLKDGEGK